MKKLIFLVLSLLLLGIIIFYFWGSSNQYPTSTYNEISIYSERFDIVSDTLKIMTYNIGYMSGMTNNLAVEREEKLFSNNLDKSIAFLRRHEPDIIAFQEIDFASKRSYFYNQLDSLGKALDYLNSAKAVNWDKSYVPFPYWPISSHFGRMLSGQAILSKILIEKNELIVLDKPLNAPFYYKQFYLDRLIQVSKVKVNNREVILMNVHLEAFDLETRQLQAEHLLSVFEEYAEEFPVLLLGDFNATPSFETSGKETESIMSIFINHPLLGMATSEGEYSQSAEDFFTFSSEHPTQKIDYIFYTKNSIEKIASGVAREAGEISDHLPVWLRFRLRKEVVE